MNQKMDMGMEQLKKIAGEKGMQTVDDIGKFFPDMKKYILEYMNLNPDLTSRG